MRNYLSANGITEITCNAFDLVRSLREGDVLPLAQEQPLMAVVWAALEDERTLFRDPKVMPKEMLAGVSDGYLTECESVNLKNVIKNMDGIDSSVIVTSIRDNNGVYYITCYVALTANVKRVQRQLFIDEVLLDLA